MIYEPLPRPAYSIAHTLQATAVLALGNMHPACHALVLAESAVLAEDYPDRQMQRVRLAVGLAALPVLSAQVCSACWVLHRRTARCSR